MKPIDLPLSALAAAWPAAPEAAHALALMDRSQTGLYVVQDGRIAYVNPAAASMLGWAPADLLGQAHAVTMAPEFREHAQRSVLRRLQGKPGRPGDVRCQRRDGSSLDVRILARRIDFQDRPAVLVTLLDISELKDALRRAEWNAGMLARTEALCRAGSLELAWPSGQVTLSAGLAALLGLPEGGNRAGSIDTLAWVPAEEQAYVAGIWRHAVVGEPFEFQHRALCADGSRLVLLHRGQLDTDGRGVALLQDISRQVEAAQRIQDLATHHEITGLPNRGWLLDQVDAAMHAARWETEVRGFALLAIELPRIAEVKTNMGFGAGDALCMALAARLRQDGLGAQWVAQLADTEFALMLEPPHGSGPDALRATALALMEQLQAPVRLGTTDVHAQCRIGMALFPADADSAEQLLERAQIARLDIAGSAGVAFYRAESTARVLREMAIESALWQALERQEFALHYQPKVDLRSGAISGAEALLRWDSPQFGPVSPAEFIPVAERSGLIGALGDWVLQQACEQIAAWRRAGMPLCRVAVNLAASQVQRPDLARQVQAVLISTGADPSWLGIEITESMVMADVQGAATMLRAIKAMGVQISLDDFGTGTSSLSQLARLPIDVVKVDRSFVCDVTADAQDVSVTRAIIHMTHGLQMRTLAEGVETEGQLSLLVAAGCDEVQGWWFSKAVPAEQLEAMVRADKRLPERYVRHPLGQRQRTLLLVDDEEHILASLKRLLRRDGYSIVTACSAEQGLLRLAEAEVDVIVSDQRMSGMTGVEFLHRAKELYPNTLRLVLSGYTELQSIIDAVNEGAIYKFLTKPWDDERLRGHIAEAFRQKELADENRRLALAVDTANATLAQVNERLAQTLQKQRNQADLLATSADSMRELFDALPVALLGVDAEGSLGFANQQALQLLPTLAGWLGLPVLEQLPAALAACLVAGQTGQTGQPSAPSSSSPMLCLQDRFFKVLLHPLPGGSSPGGHLALLLPSTPADPAAHQP